VKTWKSFEGAAGAATQQAALTGVAYAIVTGRTHRDFTICSVANLGPERALRSVGLVSPDGVVTRGRIRWQQETP